MNRTYDKGTVFLLELYREDRERVDIIGKILASGNRDVVWANHYEDEAKQHTHLIVRMPYAMTIGAFANRFGARSRLIQLCGKDREHSNYKGAMRYLAHVDKKSAVLGKRQYGPESIFGPWREEALRQIDQKTVDNQFNDSDVTLILDYIDKHEIISSADLVRWACSNNMYSVLRRSLSIVRDCLREHNNLFIRSSADEYMQAQFIDIRKRLERAENDIAYQKGYRSKRDPEERVVVNMDEINELLGRYKFDG